MSDRAENTAVSALAALTLLSAFGARFAFWGDESGTFEIVSSSWREFAAWFIAGEPHPPLYFAILKIWSGIFGFSEFALRLPSVLLFPAIVLLTWKLAERFDLSQSGRLTATAVIALHPSMWIFARMARYYTASTALFLLSTYLLFRAMRGNRRTWAIYAISVALALWTNFTVYLLLPIHLAILIWKDRTELKKWIVATSIAIIVALPALFFFFKSGISYAEDSHPSVLHAFVSFLFSGYSFLLGEVRYFWQFPTAIALFSALFLVAIAMWKRPALTLIIGCAPFLIGILVLSVFFEKLPFAYYPSRLLFLLPCFAVVVGAGAQAVPVKIRTLSVFLLVTGYAWGITGALTGKDYINPVYVLPWRDVSAKLKENNIETAVLFDWGAKHYIEKNVPIILLRDALEADLPEGRIAHIRRYGAFPLDEVNSLVEERLIAERGEPISRFEFFPENEKMRNLKSKILKVETSEYIITIDIFERRD